GQCPTAWWSPAPLQVAAARDAQQPAHPGHGKLVAVLFDPGVIHRDSLTKYAAAFRSMSMSSLALVSSRRRRAFSASSSPAGRFGIVFPIGVSVTAECAEYATLRRRLAQLLIVARGMPSLSAAAFTPIESASRTASSWNSCGYCRRD